MKKKLLNILVDSSSNDVTHRIIYEVVDETFVDLTCITPSCNDEFGFDSYRYPRAGIFILVYFFITFNVSILKELQIQEFI